MQVRYITLLLPFLALLFSSCTVVSRVTTPAEDIKNPDSAFVYGYVEAEDDTIDTVDFVQYGKVYIPPFNKPPRVLVFENAKRRSV